MKSRLVYPKDGTRQARPAGTSSRQRWRRWQDRAALALLLLVSALPVGAKENAVQCANLVYSGTHTSRCFSDEFLSAVQKETTIATERRFKAVKLDSTELFQYPFVVITGEKEFRFTTKERENLKAYLEKGGFLLASAGCSNEEWDRCFRRELRDIAGADALKKIEMDHPIFNTVYEIKKLELHRAASDAFLEGMERNGKLVLLYSRHGLNDTEHTEGCCCCGGNEITNSMQVNVNILVYALMH